MKAFTALLFMVSFSNLVYASNVDYKCRMDDKAGSLPKILEFDLPFNSLKHIDLLGNQHFLTVNFYGDFLEVSIEEKATQKVVFRSISKGPHISIQTLTPTKLSLRCRQ